MDLGDGKSELKIELKYHNGEPVIRELRRVSKPGRRIYKGVNDLPSVYNGLGIAIVVMGLLLFASFDSTFIYSRF